jgi:hypothetical protein
LPQQFRASRRRGSKNERWQFHAVNLCADCKCVERRKASREDCKEGESLKFPSPTLRPLRDI